MNDPVRFLDSANDAMPFERAALRAGQNIEPPLGAKDKIWAALGPQIGPDGGGDGAGDGAGDGGSNGVGDGGVGSSGNTFSQGASAVNSSGASISGTIGGAKILALGAAGVSAIAGVVAAVSALSSPAPVSSNIQQPAPIVASAIPAIEEAPAPTIQNEIPAVESPSFPEVVTPAPTVAPQKQAIASANPRIAAVKPKEEKIQSPETSNVEGQERASRLREENQLLGDARSALRGGDPAEALKKLDAAGGRFPDGILAQEREVLAIEALAKSGQRAAASARATAFLSAHPTSPHATKVRSFVQK